MFHLPNAIITVLFSQGFIVTTALILIGVVLHFLSQMKSKLKLIPGPKPYPLLGNLIEISQKQLHVCHLQWLFQYGGFCKYYLGNEQVLLVNDSALIKEICVKKFCLMPNRFMLTPNEFTPLTSIFGKDEYWKSLRRKLMPLFHSRNLNSYKALLQPCIADSLLGPIERIAKNNDLIDICQIFHTFALNAIGSIVFGTRLSKMDDGKLVSAVKTVIDQFNVSGKHTPISARINFVFPHLGNFLRKIMEFIPYTAERHGFLCRKYMAESIMKMQKDLQQTSSSGSDEATFSEATLSGQRTSSENQRVDLISQLTFEKLSLNVKQTQAVSLEFLLTGSETVALALTYSIYFISKHNEVERKLLSEIRTNEPLDSFRVEDMGRFPYLKAVILESLRLAPPVPNLSRTVKRQVVLKGFEIPVDTKIFIDAFGLHRDPLNFSEPEKFKPERFLNEPRYFSHEHNLSGLEKLDNLAPSAYIPFGLGPRMCLGYKLALLETTLVLLSLYREYRFELVEPQMLSETTPKMLASMTLSPTHGMPVRVFKRQ